MRFFDLKILTLLSLVPITLVPRAVYSQASKDIEFLTPRVVIGPINTLGLLGLTYRKKQKDFLYFANGIAPTNLGVFSLNPETSVPTQLLPVCNICPLVDRSVQHLAVSDGPKDRAGNFVVTSGDTDGAGRGDPVQMQAFDTSGALLGSMNIPDFTYGLAFNSGNLFFAHEFGTISTTDGQFIFPPPQINVLFISPLTQVYAHYPAPSFPFTADITVRPASILPKIDMTLVIVRAQPAIDRGEKGSLIKLDKTGAVALQENLDRPADAEFDPVSGDIFLALRNQIVRINALNRVDLVADGFEELSAITFDDEGNLFVADQGVVDPVESVRRSRIWRIDRDSRFRIRSRLFSESQSAGEDGRVHQLPKDQDRSSVCANLAAGVEKRARVPLGASFSFELLEKDPITGVTKTLEAEYKILPGTAPSNPPLGPTIALWNQHVAFAYGSSTPAVHRMQAIHTGSVRVCVTPTDPKIFPFRLRVEVVENEPNTLGNEQGQIDKALAFISNRRGYPPHLLKAQISMEVGLTPTGEWDPRTYRYEPITWDLKGYSAPEVDFPFSGAVPLPRACSGGLSNKRQGRRRIAYTDADLVPYALSPVGGPGNGTPSIGSLVIPNDRVARTTGRIHLSVREATGTIRPLTAAPADDEFSLLNVVNTNDQSINWVSDPQRDAQRRPIRHLPRIPRTTSCYAYYFAHPREVNALPAQTSLAASYGYMQVGHWVALDDLGWVGRPDSRNIGNVINPTYLWDDAGEVEKGSTSLGLGTQFIVKRYTHLSPNIAQAPNFIDHTDFIETFLRPMARFNLDPGYPPEAIARVPRFLPKRGERIFVDSGRAVP